MTIDYKIDAWECESLKLLRKATIAQGIKASCTDTTNYGSVFTRDAAMAGIAGLLYADAVIMDGLRSTIDMLFKNMGPQGQIASNFKIVEGQIEHLSFGTLSPKFDSTTWYLVSIGLLIQEGFEYDISYVKPTIALLDALEYNGKDLIYIPQGGNWADEYPFEGYILYDQVLRAWALRLLGKHFDQSDWIDKSTAIKDKINQKYFNESKGYYNCSLRPSGANDTFDFAAHCLLGFIGQEEGHPDYLKSLDWIREQFLVHGTLPGAFYPVIDEAHANWRLLSKFHLFDFKNKPHHYHNGGIWFIWVGWYALVLQQYQRFDELEQLAQMCFEILNSLDDFSFDEYITGDTKEPNGTKELCYTATGILFLCKALKLKGKKIELF